MPADSQIVEEVEVLAVRVFFGDHGLGLFLLVVRMTLLQNCARHGLWWYGGFAV